LKGYNETNELAKRIGFWVLLKRKEMGYTPEDLAKLSGISKYTIRNLELPSVSQPEGPKLETLVPILKALGIEDPIGKMLGTD
jgi:transcriptional regulator with XRE-family HTH domain